MREAQVIIRNQVGLHARPAATLVHHALQFKSRINIQCGTKKADAKSILHVLCLGVKAGSSVMICADGEDEDEAIISLVSVIEEGLGER